MTAVLFFFSRFFFFFLYMGSHYKPRCWTPPTARRRRGGSLFLLTLFFLSLIASRNPPPPTFQLVWLSLCMFFPGTFRQIQRSKNTPPGVLFPPWSCLCDARISQRMFLGWLDFSSLTPPLFSYLSFCCALQSERKTQGGA